MRASLPFDGRNAERGALGDFLKAVECGDVSRGSWLLVESLDRVSRQKPHKAVRLMGDIIEQGVTIVDLSDGGREYSAETLDQDSLTLIMMVLRFMRANEESALKSARVAAARERQRQKFASKEPLTEAYTRQLPGWLHWNDDTKTIEPILERAAIVKKDVRSQRTVARDNIALPDGSMKTRENLGGPRETQGRPVAPLLCPQGTH